MHILFSHNSGCGKLRRPSRAECLPLSDPVYRVSFMNQGQVFEVYARQVYQSELYGFIEIEELVFGEKAKVVVDPGEERLKSEFEGVKRSFIPMHAIIRIDEVEKSGPAKVSEFKGDKVMPFPVAGFRPEGS